MKKKLFCLALVFTLAAGTLASCAKDDADTDENTTSSVTSTQDIDTVAPDATPFVPEEVPSEFAADRSNITKNDDGSVSVSLEAREGESRHEFEEDDLGFVDTTTGAIIKIGMTVDEVESLIGLPKAVDSMNARIYNGIVVIYGDDGTVEQLVVAAGNMDESDIPDKFVTPRGVKLSTTLDEFKSVYGDEYSVPGNTDASNADVSSSATTAVRYYARNGNDFTYLGQNYTAENKPENDSDLVTQMFLFSNETQAVTAISIKTGTDVN